MNTPSGEMLPYSGLKNEARFALSRKKKKNHARHSWIKTHFSNSTRRIQTAYENAIQGEDPVERFLEAPQEDHNHCYVDDDGRDRIK